MLRERFLSERVGSIGWRIPHFQEWVTQRERRRLKATEERVIQKLQTLSSDQNTREVSGFRGPIIGFTETLTGEGKKRYGCIVASDAQRLEIEVVDIPVTDSKPIRKYRVFLGRFEVDGQTRISDLSSLGDKKYSWRSNSLDDEYPEKGLTLKESYRFMEELLHARPESAQSPKPAQSLEDSIKQLE